MTTVFTFLPFWLSVGNTVSGSSAKQKQCGAVQDNQEEKIIVSKAFQIGALCGAFFRAVKAVGDQAGQRGNQRSQASDVDPVEQWTRRIRETGQKDGGRDIADALGK